MKRFFVSLFLMAAVVVGQAQVKVAPQMEVGQKMVYENVTNMTIQDQEMSMSSKMAYEVTEKTADGYVVDMKISDMKLTGGDTSVGDMMNMMTRLVEGMNVRVATNQDGVPTKIANWEKVKAGLMVASNTLVDEIYAAHPEVAAVMPKDNIAKELENRLTEEELLKGVVLSPTSVFVMNGKTVSNLQKESCKNAQDIKMSRTYLIADEGKTITAISKTDMMEADLKTMIIEQVEKTMPDQAAAVKENIDAVLSSGMIKIDGSETSVYGLQDNGWLKSINYVSDTNIMMQKLKISSQVTLIENN